MVEILQLFVKNILSQAISADLSFKKVNKIKIWTRDQEEQTKKRKM